MNAGFVMKPHLLFADRDVDQDARPPAQAAAVTQDIELDVVINTMAAGDKFVADVVRRIILASLDDVGQIRYRQGILADSLAQPTVVRELYDLVVETIEVQKRIWGGWFLRSPDSVLHYAIELLDLYVGKLKQMRGLVELRRAGFRSDGFIYLFDMLAREIDDAYIAEIEAHLERLQFRDGIVLSSSLGRGNRGANYVLRRRIDKPSWRERFGLPEPGTYVWQLPDRDEAGAQALGEIKGRGLAMAAIALAQSAEHILDFFRLLRFELAFYVGCLNLHDALDRKGEPTCTPEPTPAGTLCMSSRDLYDVALTLSIAERVVGNLVDADGRALIMVTGANRGGKSTFLRSVGLAQLMMQSGMFVGASTYRADIRRGILTHFKREEDAALESGKLDEELKRISGIVDLLSAESLVLLNESFASTNEREGSEIGRQIVNALLESGIKVCYVTHMYDLAHSYYEEHRPDALFLRAERLEDRTRTFRVVKGEPLPTSHGEDVFRRVFVDGPVPAAVGAAE